MQRIQERINQDTTIQHLTTQLQQLAKKIQEFNQAVANRAETIAREEWIKTLEAVFKH